MTTDELLSRHLQPSQEKALRQFAAGNAISAEYIRLLARISGRGYRPPTTAEGWKTIYDTIRVWYENDVK
jgi:hypothetical protein